MPRKYKKKCFICKYDECLIKKQYKFASYSPNQLYGIDAEKFGKRKYLCCRCIIIIDYISYNEVSDCIQCLKCCYTTKTCRICKTNKCDTLEDFDIQYEGLADENGYYCCNCLEYNCDTWDGDRFMMVYCDRCEIIKKEKEKIKKEKKIQKLKNNKK